MAYWVVHSLVEDIVTTVNFSNVCSVLEFWSYMMLFCSGVEAAVSAAAAGYHYGGLICENKVTINKQTNNFFFDLIGDKVDVLKKVCFVIQNIAIKWSGG